MDRNPYVAGSFYPDNIYEIDQMLDDMYGDSPASLATDGACDKLVMVPHAGWIFSGHVCGQTLAEATLGSDIILLGPNHTGDGAPVALWPDGRWLFPEGDVSVNTELAEEILRADDLFLADTSAHIREHSLEVILPFLAKANPTARIVPIAFSLSHPELLIHAGKVLAEVVRKWKRPVTIIVSSDMSHFISAADAKRVDSLALDAALRLDPAHFFNTVVSKRISMCGVLPMTVGLAAAKNLGATAARVTAYTSSGDVTGDYNEVVAYAGLIAS
ncbi:MAG: AmmeMemoRadiSam system protein B [Desulfovibrio sp.]